MNSDAVGGLVGENRGLISHVSFDGEVTNRNTADHHGGNLGGLAGMNSSGCPHRTRDRQGDGPR
ncbi:GLUG motif-containing protein [Achromobacter xylosoxidans]